MLPSHRADKRMDKPSEERQSTHSTQRASLELRPLGTLSDLPTEILFRILDQIDDFYDLWLLRCSCHSFEDIIASFPMFGTPTLREF